MAVDKLVDSAQLDADLTSVANAIRTKGGTSAQLAFPQGFVDAVGNIPAGGEYSAADFANANKPVGDFTINLSGGGQYSFQYLFYNRKKIGVITAPDITGCGTSMFEGSSIKQLIAPKLSSLGTNSFKSCTSLQYAVFPKYTLGGTGHFCGCSNLLAIDFGGQDSGKFYSSVVKNCAKLNTIVLRSPNMYELSGVGNLTSGTPFANGGAGGTIYIQKVLYDHLGDGSSLDYKAATNWSTVDGYGTITWVQIEGSPYETHYVDGTPIPTA